MPCLLFLRKEEKKSGIGYERTEMDYGPGITLTSQVQKLKMTKKISDYIVTKCGKLMQKLLYRLAGSVTFY
jgi:hypothetical protein